MLPGSGRTPASELEALLRREIPLSRSMGATVSRLDDRILELAAPLGPNINHKRTAFGGSLYSLATLAAWGTVRQLLEEAGMEAHVVIREGGLSYLKPVAGEFRARCERPSGAEAERFRQALARKGKARLALRCEVRAASAPAEEAPAAVFQGVFAASREPDRGGRGSDRAARAPSRGKG